MRFFPSLLMLCACVLLHRSRYHVFRSRRNNVTGACNCFAFHSGPTCSFCDPNRFASCLRIPLTSTPSSSFATFSSHVLSSFVMCSLSRHLLPERRVLQPVHLAGHLR